MIDYEFHKVKQAKMVPHKPKQVENGLKGGLLDF